MSGFAEEFRLLENSINNGPIINRHLIEILDDDLIVNDDPCSSDTVKNIIHNLDKLACPMQVVSLYGDKLSNDLKVCCLGKFICRYKTYYHLLIIMGDDICIYSCIQESLGDKICGKYQVVDKDETIKIIKHLIGKCERKVPVFRHNLHRAFWDVLAKNPGYDKGDIMGEFSQYTFDLGPKLCVACTYANRYFEGCDSCPLVFDYNNIEDEDLKKIIYKYRNDGNVPDLRYGGCLAVYEIWKMFTKVVKAIKRNQLRESLLDKGLSSEDTTNDSLSRLQNALNTELDKSEIPGALSDAMDICRKCAEFIRDAPVRAGVYRG